VWLYRLTTNVCIDFLRQAGKTICDTAMVYTNDDDEACDIEIPDVRFSPKR
jgi:DNA-directed RNA polymerase specialized sigma24 family protein